MVTKKYIFSCANTNVTPNIQQLKQKVTAIFEEEHLVYKDMGKEHVFLKNGRNIKLYYRHCTKLKTKSKSFKGNVCVY